MLQTIGQRIRSLRQRKGISLNTFAETIGVSPGYLSNLETGKTDNIHLSLLDKLQSEYHLLPLETARSEEMDTTFQQLKNEFIKLQQVDPDGADYLLTAFEQGMNHLLKR